jgi:hypothetical protein
MATSVRRLYRFDRTSTRGAKYRPLDKGQEGQVFYVPDVDLEYLDECEYPELAIVTVEIVKEGSLQALTTRYHELQRQGMSPAAADNVVVEEYQAYLQIYGDSKREQAEGARYEAARAEEEES